MYKTYARLLHKATTDASAGILIAQKKKCRFSRCF
jgi:hypothetical protein